MKQEYRVLFAWVMILSMLFAPLAQNFAYAIEPAQSVQEESVVSNDQSSVDPNEKVRVIVELSEEPIIETATRQGVKVSELSAGTYAAREEAISDEQVQTKVDIESTGIEFEEKEDFAVIMNGFSADVAVGDLETLEGMDNVKNVFIAQKYYLPEPTMETSKEIVHTQAAWDLGYRGEGSIVAIVDSGLDVEHQDFQKLTDPSKAALSESEAKAIIAEHGLKGRYVNEKIPYAYDYFDLDQNTKENSTSSHGMHVAGTAAGFGDSFEGVAPEAQVLALKVFSNDPTNSYVYNDMYLRAIDDAAKFGADVVNMSLGSPAGMYDRTDLGAQEQAFARAEANGIVMAIAAGNERNTNDGLGLGQTSDNPDVGVVGSPSTNKSTFAVASMENTHVVSSVLLAKINGTEVEMAMNPHASSPELAGDHEYLFVGTGHPDEIAAAEAEKSKTLEGRVALVVRGASPLDENFASFTQKKDAVRAAGAVGIIIFNHAGGGEELMNMYIDPPYDFPMTFIKHSDGVTLVNNQDNATVNFSDLMSSFPNGKAGQMSSFSSWGPTPDLRIKPEITAPGGQIYSTLNDNQYGTMSGTSMATPHVTGGVAVVKEALREGTRTFASKLEEAQFTKRLMMNTADPMLNPTQSAESQTYYSVMQQGAGLMNLHKAVTAMVTATATGPKDTVDDAKLELFEVTNNTTAQVTLYNDDTVDRTFDIRVTGLAEDTFEFSDLPGVVFYSETARELYNESKDSITVPAGSTVTVPVEVTVPTDGSLADNQFINGFIFFEATDGGVDISLPFLGFYGDWSAPRALDGMVSYGEDSYFGLAQFQDRTANWPEGGSWQLPVKMMNGEDPVTIFNPNRGINPWITVLRNIEALSVLIEDMDQNVLRTITTQHNIRKIARLGGWDQAYYWNTAMSWDGRIQGAVVPEGEPYNFVMNAHINFDAPPQRYDYAVAADYTAPIVVADSVTYDTETRTLSFKASDEYPALTNAELFAGTGEAYLYHPTLDFEPVAVEIPKDFVEGETVLSAVIPSNWGFIDTVKIELVDKVLNMASTEHEFTNDEEVEESPNLTVTRPGRYSYAPKTATIAGSFWGVNSFDEVRIEQLDENDNVIASATDVNVEEALVNIKDVYSGPGYNFSGLLTAVGEFVKARVQIIRDGQVIESVGLNYFVDEEWPVLNLSAPECVEGTTADITIKASDNFPELYVYEVLPDGTLGNQIISIDGWSEDNSEILPSEGEAVYTVQLQPGVNTFTFQVYDAVGNWWRDSITIFSGSCAIFSEVDRDALLQALHNGYAINPELYTAESYGILAQALEDGEAVYEDINATQAEIDHATQTILDAIEALEEIADPVYKEQLRWLTRLAQDIENRNPALDAAIKDALRVLADPDASQEEVDDAFKTLFEAIQGDYTEVIIRPNPTPGPHPTDPVQPESTEPEETTTMTTDDVYGANRYETAVEISKEAYDEADHVVIAQGRTFPDALAAGPLASALDAPLLLTNKDLLHPATLAELARLGATKVTIVGGENTIIEEVVEKLEELGFTVDRVAGLDRYETAAAIAKEVQAITGNTEEVVLANGEVAADALAIAPYAGREGAGILLTNGTTLSDSTKALVENAEKVVFAGGTSSISKALEEEIKAEDIDVKRVAGLNRYETAVEIAKEFFPEATHAVIASGTEFPDALAGSQLAVQEKAPILLVQKGALPAVVKEYIADSLIESVSVLGGENTIGKEVRDAIEEIK